jgi:hypothetical protein
MALDQSALLEVLDALKAADVGDRVRQAAETVYQALIEAELTDTIGAARHERSDTRTNLRNGHRTRVLSTTAGDLELRIPKLRTGSFFPSLLERRRRVEQALFAVVMEAYLHGVSTRNTAPGSPAAPTTTRLRRGRRRVHADGAGGRGRRDPRACPVPRVVGVGLHDWTVAHRRRRMHGEVAVAACGQRIVPRMRRTAVSTRRARRRR